ncbi:Uncharacterised protein [Mycobacteroides abscessus subsp. abscessus]|nr:Uncharacterised protein [Mycobacteroides abscessus subsp. abscessus]
MPDTERSVIRSWQCGRVGQRVPVCPNPVDVLLTQQPPEELVVLLQVLVLLGDIQTHQGVLTILIALPDHDLEPAPAELVDGGEVLGRAHGIQQ